MKTIASPAALTADDLLGLSSPRGERYELVDGSLSIKEPPGAPHGWVEGNVGFWLSAHVRERELGRVLVGDAGFVTRPDEGTVRAPDIAFISYGRLPRGSLPEGFSRIAPDLAVEIGSPGDGAREIASKVREWLRFGVTAVWIVDPARRRVRVVTREGETVVEEGDTLRGGEAVPGFAVAVADLFTDG
jgi:Uma2 family endonuclease